MDQVRAIIETYIATKSFKATARQLQISRNTVKEYVNRGLDKYPNLSDTLSLSDSDFVALYFPATVKELSEQEKVFNNRIDYWLKELKRVGVTRYLLWEEYRQEYPDGYAYSWFCERFSQVVDRRDLTMVLEHTPGECLQIDFAGKKMQWVDPLTGEVHLCEVLLVVLPYSQYTFAIALPSQKVADFVDGLNKSLLYFGLLPKRLLSDNLKSYVIKADRYDPTYNELCVQLAAHYKIDLSSTRVAKPKDKASVENVVDTAYTRIYAPLRNEEFHSIEEVNAAIRKQLVLHNTKPYQKRAGCRKTVFEQEEAPLMQALPTELFEVKRMTQSKAAKNYHVFIFEDKTFYSVPYQYAGQQTQIIYTSKVVEVYANHKRIAVHERVRTNSYRYQTKKEHMPQNHLQWQQAKGHDAAYFLEKAAQFGPATKSVIQHILLSTTYEAQSYRSCYGVFRLAKDYGSVRLENACKRLQTVGCASYQLLKRILENKADLLEEPPHAAKTPEHENIRGPENYQ